MPQINLQELDIRSLKELAYNLIFEKEGIERTEVFRQHAEVMNNLQLVNQEISIRGRIEVERNREGNHIPASDHNSLMNSTEGNQLIT